MTAQGSQAHHPRPAAERSRAPQPLRGRLPTLNAAQATLARKLFDAMRIFAENGIRLSVAAPGPLPHELVECEAGGERVLVGIVRDEILDSCAASSWNDYQGFARCVAWTLAHERLLHALSALLGQPLMPRKIVASGNMTTDAFWLGLRAHLAQAESFGVIGLPFAVAHALSDALRNRGAPAQPTPRQDVGSLRETLRLCAVGPPLNAMDIAGLELGDVVVLGPRANVFADLQLGRNLQRPVRWPASWQDGRVQVRGSAALGYARSSSVNDSASASDHRETPSTNAAKPTAAQIPVALEFELGAIDTSLRELAQIEPGYVFDLLLQLDHAAVTIRSAGRRVGRGELVAVGDTLGVRLTEWFADKA